MSWERDRAINVRDLRRFKRCVQVVEECVKILEETKDYRIDSYGPQKMRRVHEKLINLREEITK